MKCVKWLVGSFVATVLLATVVVAAPSTNAPIVNSLDASQWTLSLAGVGSSQTTETKNSALGGELSLGHTGKLILPIEVGIRQGFSYDSANASKCTSTPQDANTKTENYSFSTRGFVDVTVLKLGNLEFDAGANLGTRYGDTRMDFTAGPEGVVRLYLKEDIDIFGRAEYRFDLASATSENKLRYVLGVRVKF